MKKHLFPLLLFAFISPSYSFEFESKPICDELSGVERSDCLNSALNYAGHDLKTLLDLTGSNAKDYLKQSGLSSVQSSKIMDDWTAEVTNSAQLWRDWAKKECDTLSYHFIGGSGTAASNAILECRINMIRDYEQFLRSKYQFLID